MTDNHQSLERFSALIDIYGSQLDRWPVDRQAWARSLVNSSPAALVLLREAKALDDVLARAPQADGAGRSVELADEIVAAATAAGLGGGSQGLADRRSNDNVVQLPLHRSRPMPVTGAAAPRPQQSNSSGWRAAAGLAASLMIGVLIGTYDLAPITLSSLVDSVGKEQDVELFVTSLGGDGLTPSFDEDLL